jgi:formylglycine-generating enzyme required for sulfatase activity
MSIRWARSSSSFARAPRRGTTYQAGRHRYTALEGERIRYLGRDRRALQDWRACPVTGVSAADAVAFALWLKRSGRLPGARLCTEYEWERAARGADARREYPHGSRLAPDDANFDETYGKRAAAMGPDEVGSHPASRSPFDVDDLTGNAFEWTASSLEPERYVVRGGSYFYESSTNLLPNRQNPEPEYRDANVGLRVCADPS